VTNDVFLSYAASETALARDVTEACNAAGLTTFDAARIPPGASIGDAVWSALAESVALVAIVSPSGPNPAMSIELGAARAWNKPIHVIVSDPASTRLPDALVGSRLYTAGRLDDVITSIRSSLGQWSETDRSHLVTLYAQSANSVDQLAMQPGRLSELTDRFNHDRQKSFSSERLLSELMRLRKQGRLARSRPKPRAKASQRDSA
jgi:hypothetical protein